MALLRLFCLLFCGSCLSPCLFSAAALPSPCLWALVLPRSVSSPLFLGGRAGFLVPSFLSLSFLLSFVPSCPSLLSFGRVLRFLFRPFPLSPMFLCGRFLAVFFALRLAFSAVFSRLFLLARLLCLVLLTLARISLATTTWDHRNQF